MEKKYFSEENRAKHSGPVSNCMFGFQDYQFILSPFSCFVNVFLWVVGSLTTFTEPECVLVKFQFCLQACSANKIEHTMAATRQCALVNARFDGPAWIAVNQSNKCLATPCPYTREPVATLFQRTVSPELNKSPILCSQLVKLIAGQSTHWSVGNPVYWNARALELALYGDCVGQGGGAIKKVHGRVTVAKISIC